MKKGFQRPWENDAIRWWSVAIWGVVWIGLFTHLNSPSELERRATEEFALRRVAEAATLQHFAGSSSPDWLAKAFGFDPESLREETAELFDEFMAEGELPASVAAHWAVMFDALGDPSRAKEAWEQINASTPLGEKRKEIALALIEDAEPSASLRAWTIMRYRQGISELPTWLLLVRESDSEGEQVRRWMEEKGTAMIRRGMFAHGVCLLVCLAALGGGIAFLRRRKELSLSAPPFRLSAQGWNSRYALREFFIAELVGVGAAFAVGFLLGQLGYGVLGWMLSGIAIFVVPAIWLSYRLTPGPRAALRLFRIRDSGWSYRQLTVFTAAGLCFFAMGIGILFLLDPDGSGSISDSLRPGDLDSPGNVWQSFLLAVLLAPIGEEWIFRGFLYGGLRKRCGPVLAAVLASGCFAAVHGYSWLGLVTVFGYGLVFCWLYQRSGSLVPGMLVHAIYNGVVTLQLVSWFSLH